MGGSRRANAVKSPTSMKTGALDLSARNTGVGKEVKKAAPSTTVNPQVSKNARDEKIIIPRTRSLNKETYGNKNKKVETNENGEKIIISWDRSSINEAVQATQKKGENNGEKITIPRVRSSISDPTSTVVKEEETNEKGEKIIIPRARRSISEVHETPNYRPMTMSSNNVVATQFLVPVEVHVPHRNNPGMKGIGYIVRRVFGNVKGGVTQVPGEAMNIKQEQTQPSTSTQSKSAGTVKQEKLDTASAETQTQCTSSTSQAGAQVSTPTGRGQKRKACGCFSCLTGTSRKQKTAKMDQSLGNQEQEADNSKKKLDDEKAVSSNGTYIYHEVDLLRIHDFEVPYHAMKYLKLFFFCRCS